MLRSLKILVFGGVILFAILAIYVFLLTRNLPSFEEITARQVKQSTRIYDRSGEVLLYDINAGQKRVVVPFADIPQSLKDATIAIEDQDFYTGPAFSIRGILRAFWVNLRSGEIRQGGSTITQQLARNAFLTADKTLNRKIKELLLALRLSRYYSKDRILELYLNEVPYGPTIYGVGAASDAYFGKQVKDLNLAESALLAALPRAPSYYSPWGSHTKELLERQKLVLRQMKNLGKISEARLQEALAYKFNFKPQATSINAPHFVFAVQDELIKKYGEEMVRSGGLTVKTTLDWGLQQVAEKAVRAGAERNDELYGGRNAALVAEDPKTGQILAMVGSRNHSATSSLPIGCTPGANCQFEPYFNVATQGLRQPGSALKPFIYLAAFERGFTPTTAIFDVPTEFVPNDPTCPPNPDFSKEDDECFHPQNFDGKFRGPVSFKTALAQSINVPAVKVLYLVGMNAALQTLQNFGLATLDNPSRYGLSLVLGGGEVRLIDLTGAYSVLAQDGVKHRQALILEVKDSRGAVLESYKDDFQIVVDPQYPRLINNILSDAEARAGLFSSSLPLTVFPGYDVALKTGTTDEYHDAWAVGYTPALVVGVWAGNNDNTPMRQRGSSILAAVPIWHDFMAEVLEKFPPAAFAKPDLVATQKPILNGDYFSEKQVRSILYYVDKNNPAGPPPSDPNQDPQFSNWESGVLTWAKDNPTVFLTALPQNQTTTPIPPQIKLIEPESGGFVSGSTFGLAAEISAKSLINKISVYFNGVQVYQISSTLPSRYFFSTNVYPPAILPQNLLEVEVSDQTGAVGRTSAIIYK